MSFLTFILILGSPERKGPSPASLDEEVNLSDSPPPIEKERERIITIESNYISNPKIFGTYQLLNEKVDMPKRKRSMSQDFPVGGLVAQRNRLYFITEDSKNGKVKLKVKNFSYQSLKAGGKNKRLWRIPFKGQEQGLTDLYLGHIEGILAKDPSLKHLQKAPKLLIYGDLNCYRSNNKINCVLPVTVKIYPRNPERDIAQL